ncbi:Meiotic recombination protein SPO11-2, partial [Geodia barretti]
MSGGNEAEYLVEELADAKLPPKAEVLAILESLTLSFLGSLARGEDPSLHLTSRSGKNVVRDDLGRVHLGKTKTVKKLFSRGGTERFVKIWQVLELVQRLLQEDKMATQREAYYCLVNHFKDQAEFNSTLQDVVALTGCARTALGICASSSGAVAGLLTWQDEGGEPIDCSTGTSGKRIPGVIEGVRFECLGARYILIVEKDAVFTYLCGQRIWDTLPCVVVTGCGYPPLSVRATVKKLSHQFSLPVLGLFDYNPHGLRILLTYKF